MSSVIFGDGPVIPESIIVPQKVGVSKAPKSSTVRKSAVNRSIPTTNNVRSTPMLTGYATPEEAMVAPVPATGIAGLAASALQQNINPSIYGNNTYGGGNYVDNYVRRGLASRGLPTIDATGIDYNYSSMEVPRTATTAVAPTTTAVRQPSFIERNLTGYKTSDILRNAYGDSMTPSAVGDTTNVSNWNDETGFSGMSAGALASQNIGGGLAALNRGDSILGGLSSKLSDVWDSIGGAKGFSDAASGLSALYSMYNAAEQNKRAKEAFNNANADRDAQYRANDAWNRGIAASGLGTSVRPTKG